MVLITVAIMVMTAGCDFIQESDANVSIQFDKQSVSLQTDKDCIVDIYVEFDNGTNNEIQDVNLYKNDDNYLGPKKIMKTQNEADDVKVSQVKITDVKEENKTAKTALIIIIIIAVPLMGFIVLVIAVNAASDK